MDARRSNAKQGAGLADVNKSEGKHVVKVSGVSCQSRLSCSQKEYLSAAAVLATHCNWMQRVQCGRAGSNGWPSHPSRISAVISCRCPRRPPPPA